MSSVTDETLVLGTGRIGGDADFLWAELKGQRLVKELVNLVMVNLESLLPGLLR